MGGIAHRTCRRCGKGQVGERIVAGHCLRCRALELIDSFEDQLAGHSRRVTMIAMAVAEQMRLADELRRDIELGGLLHDIGKLVIPASILAKAGPLDEREQEVMRTHVIEGEKLCDAVAALPVSVPAVVRASHERWDGKGYPDGLRGEEIPLPARVVSCADAFDAMTSSRSYRAALPMDLAICIVREEAGRQFDPGVAEALVAAVEDLEYELAAEPVTTAFDQTLRRLQRQQVRA
jgi:HD-GYP domain-containing protein (c-di-GMP phosphodiesterase class II)